MPLGKTSYLMMSVMRSRMSTWTSFTDCGMGPGRTTPSSGIRRVESHTIPPESQRLNTRESISGCPPGISSILRRKEHREFITLHVHQPGKLTPILSVIFQAGTSKVGQAFAAKHAEAVYIGGLVPSQAAYQIKAARDLCRAADRDPYTIKFFAAINPILGRTMEEAQAKYDEAMKYADVIGALAQFSGYTGIDMSKYPLDEELKLDTSNPKESAVQGFLGNFGDSQKDGDVWTPRKLGQKIAVGGFHPTPVGTPEMVADIMEQVSPHSLHFVEK